MPIPQAASYISGPLQPHLLYYLNDDNDLCSPADIVSQPDPLVRPLLHQAGVGVDYELEDLGPLQT